jgi:hypothetical protein
MMMHYNSTNAAKRTEQKVKDKKFLITIVNKVTEYKGSRLLQNEIEGLVHYVDSLNFALMQHDPPSLIVDKIASNFSKQLLFKSGVIIDNHEIMKRQIGVIPHDGKESLYADADCPATMFNISDPNIANGREGFRSGRARNTEESDENYYSMFVDSNRNGIPDIVERSQTRAPSAAFAPSPAVFAPSLGLVPQPTPQPYIASPSIPRSLENDATPFSSATDKYPRVKKQNIQNVYLCLDSMERNLSTDPSVFKWTVLQSNNTQQGTVNTLSDNIHNIVNVQFNRFRIPYVGSADNVYQKVSVFIEEFSNQAVLIRKQRRYHMMFDAEINGNQIELTPEINDEGRFRFYTPVNILDGITMRFMSPFVPIVFQKDRFDITITSLNPTQSILGFSENHEVADGELVHITAYDTLAPTTDVLSIMEINREAGHIVTFINNTTLRVDVNLTSVTTDPTNLSTCFIATRRLIMPIRMEYKV